MFLIVNIPDGYVGVVMRNQRVEGSAMDKMLRQAVIDGTPIDKIKSEIENVEINGHVRDAECFSAGLNTALDIIDKYAGGK